MVVDSLFLCVCEDRNMNSNDGRWKNTRLAELGGHKRQNFDEHDGAELQDVPEKYWSSKPVVPGAYACPFSAL